MSILDRDLAMHFLAADLLKADALNENDLIELYVKKGEYVPKEDIFIKRDAGRFVTGAVMVNLESNEDPFARVIFQAVDDCNFSNIHCHHLHDGAVIGVSVYFENSDEIH